MKVGLVIYGTLDTVSGGYLYDRKLVESLQAQGDRVEIISLPWRNYASHLTDNFTFRLPKGLDILIQDELNHPSLIGANRGRHPYQVLSLVHHLRCSELRPAWQNWIYRIVEKNYLQSVDGFIFNSKTTQSVVQNLIGNYKPSVVAYPPTDRFGDDLIPEDVIRERTKRDKLQILFLGNIIERKGLHILIEALRRAGQDNISSYKLDVVGGMNAEPRHAEGIRQQVMVNGLSSIVAFHGALDNEPLIEIYKRSHVMVVPSSYEGYGIVYLEGMGFGLPAIGTMTGAAGEIITHGKDGYLIEPGDAEALAKYITVLATDRELLLELSLNALKRYRSQPKWIETAGRIREFLQKQIEEFTV